MIQDSEKLFITDLCTELIRLEDLPTFYVIVRVYIYRRKAIECQGFLIVQTIFELDSGMRPVVICGVQRLIMDPV